MGCGQLDNYGPKRTSAEERAAAEEAEWAEEDARLAALKAKSPVIAEYLDAVSSKAPAATATRPIESIKVAPGRDPRA